MKIIIKKSTNPQTENLGAVGDIIEVSDGFARNYLIPKGFAIKATRKNLALVGSIKEKEEIRLAQEIKEAEMILSRIVKETCIFTRLADENGHLFGSVSEKDIVAGLAEKGLEVDKSSIRMEHHLKEIGEHDITIKLKENVEGQLHIIIQIQETSQDENKTTLE